MWLLIIIFILYKLLINLTDDPVYLEKENLLDEYVLNDKGVIFCGNYRQIGGRPWNFGQVVFRL